MSSLEGDSLEKVRNLLRNLYRKGWTQANIDVATEIRGNRISQSTLSRVLKEPVGKRTLEALLQILPELQSEEPPQRERKKKGRQPKRKRIGGPHGASISSVEMDDLRKQLKTLVEAEDYPLSQRMIAKVAGVAPRDLHLILWRKAVPRRAVYQKLLEAFGTIQNIIDKVRSLEPHLNGILQENGVSEKVREELLRNLVRLFIEEKIEELEDLENFLPATIKLSQSL
jgi:hypothetical protein